MENKTNKANLFSFKSSQNNYFNFSPRFFFLPLFTKKLNNFVSFPGSADNPE